MNWHVMWSLIAVALVLLVFAVPFLPAGYYWE